MSSSSSCLQGAHDFRIDNLMMTYTTGKTGKSAMEYLEEHIAIGAIHSSDERCDAPTCFPETRIAIQKDIVSWITHGDQDEQPMQLMWLSGPAGSGKTAIAGSVAETCYERDTLAACFFFSSFSSAPECSSKRYLVPTLVYQLLQHESLGCLEEHVLRAIQRDPIIFKKRLKDQLEELILKPLRKVRSRLPRGGHDWPKVMIVDGVDEVRAERNEHTQASRHWHTTPRRAQDDQLEIIACLFHAERDPNFPFRIIIISRPERIFTEFFSMQARGWVKQLFLDEKYDPDSDIKLYLTSNLAELRRRYDLLPSWPDERSIKRLVWNASGQFIYAATVIRFVSEGKTPPPSRLDSLLSIQTDGFKPLDALYTYILASNPNPSLAAEWISVIDHLASLSAWALKQFFQSEPGEGEHILRPLASLIFIPEAAKEYEVPLRIYHKSLLDFLYDKTRSPEALYLGHQRQWSLPITRAWMSLTTHKAPRAPLPGPQKDAFLSAVTHPRVVIQMSICLNAFKTFTEEDLISCDLYWWTSQMLEERLDRYGNHVETTRDALFYASLTCIHYNCRRSQDQCRESCRKWSDDILRACLDHGWTVPSENLWLRYANEEDQEQILVLYREIMTTLKPPATKVNHFRTLDSGDTYTIR